MLDIEHSIFERIELATMKKPYSPPKLNKLPLKKTKTFLQNQAGQRDTAAKDLLDPLLLAKPKKVT